MAMRLKKLIDRFLDWCDKVRRPRTTENYRYFLEKFLQHVGNVPIDKLKPVHLSMYGKTWHQIQAVQRLFQWAKDDLEVIHRNVFSKVPRPAAGQRTRILSPRDMARYFRRARPGFRLFLRGMRETLARPQEIRLLDWPMLQAELPNESLEDALAGGRAIFVLREYKAQERRLDPTVPRVLLVNRRLGRLLLRLRAQATSLTGPVFLNDLGKRWSGNAVRCRMRRLRKRMAKVEDKGKEPIVAYTIRHSMATIAAASRVRDRVLADVMGHTDPSMTWRYQHLQVSHLRKAMEGIEEDRRLEREARKEEFKKRKAA